MRIPIIAGNWKLYKTVAEGRELVTGLLAGLGAVTDREVVVCPPYTALFPLGELLANTPLALGAPEVFSETQGAFTGAVAPQM